MNFYSALSAFSTPLISGSNPSRPTLSLVFSPETRIVRCEAPHFSAVSAFDSCLLPCPSASSSAPSRLRVKITTPQFPVSFHHAPVVAQALRLLCVTASLRGRYIPVWFRLRRVRERYRSGNRCLTGSRILLTRLASGSIGAGAYAPWGSLETTTLFQRHGVHPPRRAVGIHLHCGVRSKRRSLRPCFRYVRRRCPQRRRRADEPGNPNQITHPHQRRRHFRLRVGASRRLRRRRPHHRLHRQPHRSRDARGRTVQDAQHHAHTRRYRSNRSSSPMSPLSSPPIAQTAAPSSKTSSSPAFPCSREIPCCWLPSPPAPSVPPRRAEVW